MELKPQRTNRNRAYYRHHRKRVIHRKRSIIYLFQWNVPRNQFGRLSKGKIHCSCRMCREKTREIGYPKTETARLIGLKQQLNEHMQK